MAADQRSTDGRIIALRLLQEAHCPAPTPPFLTLAPLLAALSDPEPSVRLAAVACLAKMAPGGNEGEPRLPGYVLDAVEAAYPPPPPPPRPPSATSSMRSWMSGLGPPTEEERDDTEAKAKKMADDAEEAWGEWGRAVVRTHGRTILEALLGCVQDSSEEVREASIAALLAPGTVEQTVVQEQLSFLFAHPNNWVRRLVLLNLTNHEEHFERILIAVRDRDLSVRGAAVHVAVLELEAARRRPKPAASSRVGASRKSSEEVAKECLKIAAADADSDVRTAARVALADEEAYHTEISGGDAGGGDDAGAGYSYDDGGYGGIEKEEEQERDGPRYL